MKSTLSRSEAIIATMLIAIAAVALPPLSVHSIKPKVEAVKGENGTVLSYRNVSKVESRPIGFGYSLILMGAVQIWLVWKIRKTQVSEKQ